MSEYIFATLSLPNSVTCKQYHSGNWTKWMKQIKVLNLHKLAIDWHIVQRTEAHVCWVDVRSKQKSIFFSFFILVNLKYVYLFCWMSFKWCFFFVLHFAWVLCWDCRIRFQRNTHFRNSFFDHFYDETILFHNESKKLFRTNPKWLRQKKKKKKRRTVWSHTHTHNVCVRMLFKMFVCAFKNINGPMIFIAQICIAFTFVENSKSKEKSICITWKYWPSGLQFWWSF